MGFGLASQPDRVAVCKVRILMSDETPRLTKSPRRFTPAPQQDGIRITKSSIRDESQRRSYDDPMAPDASNPAYVHWLVRQSMLSDANRLSRKLSGRSTMWQNPYARPDARRAISLASVWLGAYPASYLAEKGQSFLGALGEESLWEAFQKIGIDAVHTGPVKRAGGISGWELTPSVDGHFDRISTHIDPAFGTEDEFRRVCDVASSRDGSIIDDIVPGHTGKGADFRLAEMAYEDYPGIYHMVEIPQEDWGLLPEVLPGRDSANLNAETERILGEKGYIIGALQRVMFYLEGIKETNWSATDEVLGVDGVVRRWVYLHYFKEGQPSINWLDPTFAGMRLIAGDAIHSLSDLGTSALRLDANGFLGIEKSEEGKPAWSEGHPLSIAGNHLIAGMARKVGGFTFQELNLTIENIRDMGRSGADLSYDFVSRPGAQHALATGDTGFLRLCIQEAQRLGVEPVALVHGLQNHDELTYELRHWETVHAGNEYTFRGRTYRGEEIARTIRAEMVSTMVENNDYNHIFTTNGISCSSTSMIAAIQGHHSLATVTGDSVEKVRKAHLLLAMFAAWQPGAMVLSGWDLVGALPLSLDEVGELAADGDTRWIGRGAYDIMGNSNGASESEGGMKTAPTLYGPVPEQLKDPNSFASRLAEILRIRHDNYVHYATLVEIPEVAHRGMLVLVHRLDGGWISEEDSDIQLTILNFTDQVIEGTVHAESLAPQQVLHDAATGKVYGTVDELKSFAVTLEPYGGLFLTIPR